MFGILREANLSARPTKCFLGFSSVECLDHQDGDGKLGTNPLLLKKIQDTVAQTTKKQVHVRSFLELTCYYRMFVPNFVHTALALTDFTKKGQPEKVLSQE